MDRILTPTSHLPHAPIRLCDGIAITPAPAVSIKLESVREQSETPSSAVYVEGFTSPEHFKAWLLFHNLVFGLQENHLSFAHFSHRNEMEKVVFNTAASERPIDYEDLFYKIYFYEPNGPSPEGIGYARLYERYVEHRSDAKRCQLLDAFLNNLMFLAIDPYPINPSPSIRMIDDRYWRLCSGFSVIEKVIGKQPTDCWVKCPNCNQEIKGNCGACGRDIIPHTKKPEREWIAEGMLRIIGNEQLADQYTELAWGVRQYIRHHTVHGAISPAGPYADNYAAGNFTYGLEYSLGNFQNDDNAVISLMHATYDVARHLLLSLVFQLPYFPQISFLSSFTLNFED